MAKLSGPQDNPYWIDALLRPIGPQESIKEVEKYVGCVADTGRRSKCVTREGMHFSQSKKCTST